MAPLAVPHHFLRVSPFAITSSRTISWELKGERCVSYVKQVALAQTRDGLCAFPHSLRLCASRFLTLSFRLLGPGLGWALITGRRSLWFDFCGAPPRGLLCNYKTYMREGRGMLISQRLLWPLCQVSERRVWITLTVCGRKKKKAFGSTASNRRYVIH